VSSNPKQIVIMSPENPVVAASSFEDPLARPLSENHLTLEALSKQVNDYFESWLKHDRVLRSLDIQSRYSNLGFERKALRQRFGIRPDPHPEILVRDIFEDKFLALVSSPGNNIKYLLNHGPLAMSLYERSLWLRLFVLASNDNIPAVIDYCKQQPKDSLFLISHLIKNIQNYSGKIRLILDQLDANEVTNLMTYNLQYAVPMVPVADIIYSTPLGKIPFASWSAHLYRSNEQKRDLRNDGHINFNRVWLAMSVQVQVGGRSYQGLLIDLLKYHHNRSNNRDEYFSFFGITSGYSRTEKLNAVNKILVHIYGTEAEKQAAGPFSLLEKNILNDSDLGRATRKHSVAMIEIVAIAERYAPDVASSLTAGSSGAS